MNNPLNRDSNQELMQVFNPRRPDCVGTTNGKLVTIQGTDYPLAEFSAFCTTVDTPFNSGGYSRTLPAETVRACKGNTFITFETAVLIEVM
jgi:hypothetical protein